MKGCFQIINIENLLDEKDTEIINKMIANGATVYLVGGAIRNYFLEYPINDLDFEVYNIKFERLKEVLSEYNGYVNEKFQTIQLENIELAIPRLETKIGKAYTDYQLEFDEDMDPEQAIQRRDFTVNSLMYNLNENKLIDYCNGMQDIKDRRLKALNIKKYPEDPIRILRMLKYQAKYNLSIDSLTLEESSKISKDLFEQPNQMVAGLLNSFIYSKFFNVDLFFETLHDFLVVDELKNKTTQNIHHPEHSLFNHIKGCLLCLRILEIDNERDYRILFWTILFHDYGKLLGSENHNKTSIAYFDKYQPFVLNKDKEVNLVKILIEDHMIIRKYAYKNDIENMKILKAKYKNQFYLLELLSICDFGGRVIDFNENEFRFRMEQYQKDVIDKYKEL